MLSFMRGHRLAFRKGIGSMSRVSFLDRGRLSWLALRRGLCHLSGRIASHPLARFPFWSRAGERLLIAPQDLRTADPTRASEIYSGRYAFAGKVVICDGRSPFDMQPPSEEWAETLQGFGWLRHLRAAESTITRANARALVEEWIGLQGRYHPIAWQPETVGRRLISWLAQATLILDDADFRFYRRFLRNLIRQVRYLRHTAGQTRDGVPRLQARIALVYAALCMAGQARHLRRATRNLVHELERQILPDGGHISRNPNALLELLLDLLPLSQTFSARNVSPPSAILNAIDRMMPMLRFFRHSDGAFALFNGMGPTWPELLATILAYDDARGTPVSNAAHSGYQRLEAGLSVVLMDTGCPPPIDLSADAHAGCLSFELSSKYQRIVVNCGLPATSRENWRQVARATAAHSTAVLNDASSCEFLENSSFKRLFGMPIVRGPTHVPVTREQQDDGALLLRTAHDGYVKRFGIVHHRTLILSGDGSRLDGEDVFLPPDGSLLPNHALDEFAIRFHLHPGVKANLLSDGHGAILTMPNREVWHFHAPEDQVDLAESVYLAAPDGPRRTQQIVISGQARKISRVNWNFSHAPQPSPTTRRGRASDPELPL
jgi:uncharacterized heparinase superfamily protein